MTIWGVSFFLKLRDVPAVEFFFFKSHWPPSWREARTGQREMPNSDSENFSDSEFDEARFVCTSLHVFPFWSDFRFQNILSSEASLMYACYFVFLLTQGSDFQSSRGGGSEAKPTPSKEGRSQLKNLPFDEALDLSASDASVSRQGSEPRGSPGRAASSQSMSKTPGSERRRGGGGGGGAKGETMVANQQHDEAHSLGSDGDSLVSEESVMTNEDSEIAPQKNSATDRPAAKLAVESAARQRAGGAAALGPSAASSAQPKPAALNARSSAGVGSAGGGGVGSSSQGNTSSKGGNAAASESESDDSDEDEESRSGVPVAGAYNPADYKHLPVNAEIKDLFQYITRYKPHEVELDSTLKCFIPDFIPAVGEMDAFIKVPPPDASRDELGLKVLDEPAAQQSDATVLELQLRAGSKKK